MFKDVKPNEAEDLTYMLTKAALGAARAFGFKREDALQLVEEGRRLIEEIGKGIAEVLERLERIERRIEELERKA